jgi:hypothetical protein
MSKHWQFDIYDSIRAVNWMRREVAKKRPDLGDKELVQSLRSPFESSQRPAFLSDDSFLQPYLPDDALLPALSCESWNDERQQSGDEMKCEAASGAGPSAAAAQNGEPASGEVEALRAENLRLREKLERQDALIEAVLPTSPCRVPQSFPNSDRWTRADRRRRRPARRRPRRRSSMARTPRIEAMVSFPRKCTPSRQLS